MGERLTAEQLAADLSPALRRSVTVKIDGAVYTIRKYIKGGMEGFAIKVNDEAKENFLDQNLNPDSTVAVNDRAENLIDPEVVLKIAQAALDQLAQDSDADDPKPLGDLAPLIKVRQWPEDYMDTVLAIVDGKKWYVMRSRRGGYILDALAIYPQGAELMDVKILVDDNLQFLQKQIINPRTYQVEKQDNQPTRLDNLYIRRVFQALHDRDKARGAMGIIG